MYKRQHYYCSAKGLVPEKFKKTKHPDFKTAPYYFWAFFPTIGWHGVSWVKCIDGWTLTDGVASALRISVRPIIEAYRNTHLNCEKCGKPTADIDHVSPEFKTIAEQAIAAMTQADWDSITYDWISEETFTLPENLSCVQFVKNAHETAVLMSVCKDCHRANARNRKMIDQI